MNGCLMASTNSSDFSSFDSLHTSDACDAYLLEVWLKSRLFYLRLTHPVDDVVALMEEFEIGAALKFDAWK
jgi:hypothetical protein